MADSARLLFLFDTKSLILIVIEHKIGATWNNAIIAIQKDFNDLSFEALRTLFF